MIKLNLIDNFTQHRGKLSEGRNWGMGFALAHKDGNSIVTNYSLSCCREYLNDCLFSELTGKKINIYGLQAEKKNLFDLKKNQGYMVFGILNYNRSGEYPNQRRDTKVLEDNYKNLQVFINSFEKRLGLKKLTKIFKLQENRFVSIFPLFWAQSTYLISLYSFLFRAGIHYGSGDVIDYLTNFNYEGDDKYMINSVLPKLNKILSGVIPKQNLNSIGQPHGIGIVNYNLDIGGENISVADKLNLSTTPVINKMVKMTLTT